MRMLRRRRQSTIVLILIALAAALLVPASASAAAKTKLISKSSAGVPGDSGSYVPSVSASGRFIAFASDADNLVGNDSNGDTDVFVRDRKKGKTRRVSLRSNEKQGNDDSFDPAISASGRFVAFASRASNLVKNDTNEEVDIFVRDRRKGRTWRVSVRSNGAQANGSSSDPSISADGRYIAFASVATNLIKNDKTGSARDVFIHDRVTGKTRLASRSSKGGQGTGTGFASNPAISANGRFVVFDSSREGLAPGDGDAVTDVFIHDRVKRKTRLVSKSSGGSKGTEASRDPDVSGTGRFVVFRSAAPNLIGSDGNGRTDIFIRDRKKGKTKRISVATGGAEPSDGMASRPAISTNGRIVTWIDSSDELGGAQPPDIDDVYIRDRRTRRTTLVHRSSGGVAGDDHAENAALDADGTVVAFETEADNLVGIPVNDDRNVFVRAPLR